MKRTFAEMSLAEALQMVPTDQLRAWTPDVIPRPPSATIVDYMNRLRVFDSENTAAAKLLLIDALLAEVVPSYPGLKVWKAMPLDTDVLTGCADYLISPDYAYLKSPLLCAVEAKRDDFVQGRAQCIAEMVACRWNNRQAKRDIDVYGIVSNGQSWQFYRLSPADIVHETSQYTLGNLPPLLAILDLVWAACADNIP